MWAPTPSPERTVHIGRRDFKRRRLPGDRASPRCGARDRLPPGRPTGVAGDPQPSYRLVSGTCDGRGGRATGALRRLVFGDWSARSGLDAGGTFVGIAEVTAIFVANDHMALGLLVALAESGIRAPAISAMSDTTISPNRSSVLPPYDRPEGLRGDRSAKPRSCPRSAWIRWSRPPLFGRTRDDHPTVAAAAWLLRADLPERTHRTATL